LKFANFGFITAPRVLISFQRAPSTKNSLGTAVLRVSDGLAKDKRMVRLD